MKTSLKLHEFFKQQLWKPVKDLLEKAKKGRGIYRRVFFYIPAHGPGLHTPKLHTCRFKVWLCTAGSIDHWQDEYSKLNGSSKLHQVRTTEQSTAEAGVLECRHRSCHQCDSFWDPKGSWSNCENIEVVGVAKVEELASKTLRSHTALKEQGRELGKVLKKGDFVVLEIDDSKMEEDMPWCILEVGPTLPLWCPTQLRCLL